MGAASTQGPLGISPIPPIDAGTSALTATPTVTPVGASPSASGAPGAAPPTAAAPASESADTDPDIEALNLAGNAKKGAYALKKAHPSVTFTSGFREKEDQARAMSQNVAKKDKRKWIEKTYVSTMASKACQKWVDDNPDKTTEEDIAAGLLSVLNELTDDELAGLSRHLIGKAFDVQPVETDADDIKKTIRSLEGLHKFLEKEDELVRWHAQFS
ncbi:MAG TPA: hypothetical protein VFB92_11255 [Vicinamibacterales bacterium]|jgi:hypothetical protein|nr:hypothetical protein [Vicinamibacterales bacterium]